MDKIRDLEQRASAILEEKRRHIPRRPIVIEFCGTPKSGKTTCINALNIFLKRNGFKTQLLTERASVCPIVDKHNPSFNIWTSCMAIGELSFLYTEKNKELDVIILDRGIFDGLCWFEWLNASERLDSKEYKVLSDFLTQNIYASKIDIVYVFTVDASIAMEREYAGLLTKKEGSIMNIKTLESFSKSTNDAQKKYSGNFKAVHSIDTSEIDQNEVNVRVTEGILSELSDLVEEKVGYVDSSELDSLKSETIFEFNDIANQIKIKFGKRNEIEADESKIQLIPIVTITSNKKDEVFVVRKNDKAVSESSPEKKVMLAYLGGHIRDEDKVANSDNSLETIKAALKRELSEEVRQSFSFDGFSPRCIWDKSSAKSMRHLAVWFHKQVDFANIKFKLDENEFVKKKNSKKSGHPMSYKDISGEKTESWTKIILHNFLGIEMPQTQSQLFNA